MINDKQAKGSKDQGAMRCNSGIKPTFMRHLLLFWREKLVWVSLFGNNATTGAKISHASFGAWPHSTCFNPAENQRFVAEHVGGFLIVCARL